MYETSEIAPKFPLRPEEQLGNKGHLVQCLCHGHVTPSFCIPAGQVSAPIAQKVKW